MLLSEYLTQVRQLVHDASGTDWTDAELTGHINAARLTLALDCHCVRDLKGPLDLIANQETYPFTGAVGGVNVTAGGSLYTSAPTVTFTGGSPTTSAAATAVLDSSGAVSAVYMTSWGLGYQSAPAVGFSGGGGSGAIAEPRTLLNVLDILSLTMRWSSWRTMLQKRVFSSFQAYVRANPTLRGVPSIWSPYREQQKFYVGQIPDSSNQYTIELDIVVLPDPLVVGTDADNQIIMPYADAVQYYAAYMALLKLQNPDIAIVQLRNYQRRTKQILTTRRSPWISDPYAAYAANYVR